MANKGNSRRDSTARGVVGRCKVYNALCPQRGENRSCTYTRQVVYFVRESPEPREDDSLLPFALLGVHIEGSLILTRRGRLLLVPAFMLPSL